MVKSSATNLSSSNTGPPSRWLRVGFALECLALIICHSNLFVRVGQAETHNKPPVRRCFLRFGGVNHPFSSHPQQRHRERRAKRLQSPVPGAVITYSNILCTRLLILEHVNVRQPSGAQSRSNGEGDGVEQVAI